MKKTSIALSIAALLLSSNVSASNYVTPEDYIKSESQTIYNKVNNRIEEIRLLAQNENNIVIINGQRNISINDINYRINDDNYIQFDFPTPTFTDETRFRNVFDFIGTDWELTWYDLGIVMVNKTFGNYDYGNGCLIEYSPNNLIATPAGDTHLVIETASCAIEANEELSITQYLSTVKELNFATLGYQQSSDFAPESIAVINDKLYVGNTNSAFSRIDRFDLATQQLLTPITGFTKNGVAETYRVVSDITEHKNRLYVASLSSNRVDIYDTQNDDQIIMSLGTGSWSGDTFSKTLTHPYAVAANDNYIFVADITGKISVYDQADVTESNHKQALKYAFLSLPESNSTWKNVKLEVIGDELLASFDSTATYVYDIAKLEKSTELVEPKYTTHFKRNIYEAQDGAIYTADKHGQVAVYSAGKLHFNDPENMPVADQHLSTYFDENEKKEKQLTASFDLAVEDKTLAILQSNTVLLADIESIKVHLSNTVGETPPVIDLTAENVVRTPLLFDGESWESLTENHYVRINRLLSGQQDKANLAITSYAAQETYDLNVEAQFKGSDAWLVLGSVERLPAFNQYMTDRKIMDNYAYPTTDGTQSVAFYGIEDVSYLPSDLLDIRLTSTTDEFVKKITDLRMKWGLSFGKYSEANGKWAKITPVYAREWMIIMANFAYVMNSPEFEHLWFNYKQSIGGGEHEFYGNAGPVYAPGGYFNSDDYQRIFKEFMDRGGIRLGITTIGGGLGGGDVLGIDTWNYYAHYYKSGIGVVGHEFGHHWGRDGSGFSAQWTGLQLMSQDVHQMMIRSQELPYLDDNTNGFYKTPREDLYNGVAHNMRVQRPASELNIVERYFVENPVPLK
ncbi:hypothetical protein CTM97_06095 [Photobacterium phosphoreum]|uniref:Uncharacterized protein n=1 Tax=Photobacterium phosphoreum TaxID=659 RepID=A0A2T3JTR0_PHOPO|nr:hypothetical protein [Photobacterium phosphoreum]PSU25890.1 hypothetical protein CTM96_07180 [Photobacterium phosphoreum]PSU43202.1 hypothetical protein CTM97_06095 [Photobacterium phosphoreum]PSU52533.1 hypothetical protein C9J18_08240 [Photobacterium phosphoreum]